MRDEETLDLRATRGDRALAVSSVLAVVVIVLLGIGAFWIMARQVLHDSGTASTPPIPMSTSCERLAQILNDDGLNGDSDLGARDEWNAANKVFLAKQCGPRPVMGNPVTLSGSGTGG
jgi:hypothetical protein